MLCWLTTRLRRKVGERKILQSGHRTRVPRAQAAERDARRTEVAGQTILQGISPQQALPSLPTLAEKTGFSKIGAAPKPASHQRPGSALHLSDTPSKDELLPQPVRAERAAGGWSQAGHDDYLYIPRSGEFYFLLSSPSNR